MELTAIEAAARDAMGEATFDYYAGGSETETTLRENETAWEGWRLRPRVLRDVREVHTATTLLGAPVGTPIGVAPAAFQALAHPDAEAAMARGAADAGALMTVPTLASVSLEDVAAVDPVATRWFQLYIFRDRGYAGELVDRAVAAGYRALVLTVDVPVLGRRLRDAGHGFSLRGNIRLANVPRGTPDDGLDDVTSGVARLYAEHDRSLTFEDIVWLGERAGDVPVVLKGIVRGDDARAAVRAGAQAVWVSNHGGRQLDRTVPTADVLTEVVDEVGDEVEVYVDGGIRRGVDVLTALALGARAAFVARPALWGLASGGPQGVTDVLRGLTEELTHAATLAGVPDLRAVPRDLVTPAGSISSRTRPRG